jgi:SAM-dependent methyltransferase
MIRIPKEELRSEAQLIRHYEVEKELAKQLINSNKDERKRLYTELYDELFERVPDHPLLTRKLDPVLQKKSIQSKIGLLSKYFFIEDVFLELGPGDCALSFELCNHFKNVYAIDVSEILTDHRSIPKNFKLICSDGSSVDVPSGTVNVAYSNQLMEHLHPDDALDQIKGIYKALSNSGIYICLTPHRFMGPSDISKYFDKVATGFHLKEYTYKELCTLLKSAGFRTIHSIFRVRGIHFKVPIYIPRIIEFFLEPFPYFLRKKISNLIIIRNILSISLIAKK